MPDFGSTGVEPFAFGGFLLGGASRSGVDWAVVVAATSWAVAFGNALGFLWRFGLLIFPGRVASLA